MRCRAERIVPIEQQGSSHSEVSVVVIHTVHAALSFAGVIGPVYVQ